MTPLLKLRPLLIGLLVAACTVVPSDPNGTPESTSADITPVPSEVDLTRTPPPAAQATPIFSQLNQELAMRGSYSADVAALQGIPVYQLSIEVDFNPAMDQAAIVGHMLLAFEAPGEEALTRFPLMLWPNNEQYQSEMTITSAIVNGYVAEPQADPQAPAIWLDLYQPVEPGQDVTTSVAFEIEVFEVGEAAPKRFGIVPGGVLIAPTFYPLLPRWLEDGWEVEQAPSGGDTTNSEVAFYEWEISAPAELGLAASGAEVDRQETDDGRQLLRLATGPVRDVAFALGPFEVLTDEVGDIQLRAWVLEEHLQEGLDMLQAAKLQMETMIDWVGPYPYTELDLVDAPGAFGGIEYPGLVYIGTLGTEWLIEPTVHEVAHQWFYGLIGDDQLDEPWLDEAAATYAEALYFERASFNATRTNFLADLRGVVRQRTTAEMPIGLPIDEYPSARDYAIIVYLKGALFFDELRLRLGEQGFKAFLQSYFNQYRYAVATSEDFQQTAEAVCECDLQALFDLWVYEGGPIPEF
jgi:hypothetical protein